MKKLRKIKIIEEGRIFSPEELNLIRGGYQGCSNFTGCNTYSECGWFSYESCKPSPAAYGYESDDGTISCGEGHNYATCGLSQTYTSCGSDISYKS